MVGGVSTDSGVTGVRARLKSGKLRFNSVGSGLTGGED